MAVHYFKCECGEFERRVIAPTDKVGYRLLANGRTWRFDPTHHDAVTKDTAEKLKDVVCPCGKTASKSEDPQAVTSFMQLNWLGQ